jgi:macrodomain Ter protein organizer (MatP/YcbG family)
MKQIILNPLEIVTNRKQISLKLKVWKDVITCAKHENVTVSRLISYLIDKHIKENNYNIEEMFKANLSIKQQVLDDLVNVEFDSIKRLTEI